MLLLAGLVLGLALSVSALCAPAPSWQTLGVSAPIYRRLAELGLREPLEVQALAWPVITSGQDAVVLSEAGSGKTLAYLAPLMHMLLETTARQPARRSRAVIAVPSADLAAQVLRVARSLANGLPLVCAPAASAGAPHSDECADVIVGTVPECLPFVVHDRRPRDADGSAPRRPPPITRLVVVRASRGRSTRLCPTVGVGRGRPGSGFLRQWQRVRSRCRPLPSRACARHYAPTARPSGRGGPAARRPQSQGARVHQPARDADARSGAGAEGARRERRAGGGGRRQEDSAAHGPPASAHSRDCDVAGAGERLGGDSGKRALPLRRVGALRRRAPPHRTARLVLPLRFLGGGARGGTARPRTLAAQPHPGLRQLGLASRRRRATAARCGRGLRAILPPGTREQGARLRSGGLQQERARRAGLLGARCARPRLRASRTGRAAPARAAHGRVHAPRRQNGPNFYQSGALGSCIVWSSACSAWAEARDARHFAPRRLLVARASWPALPWQRQPPGSLLALPAPHACHPMPATHCLPPTACHPCLPPTACHPVPAIPCLQPPACNPLHATLCLQPGAALPAQARAGRPGAAVAFVSEGSEAEAALVKEVQRCVRGSWKYV